MIAYFRNDRQSAIQDAIQDALWFRGYLERQAEAARHAGGKYIRPIVLFQAQPNTNEEIETFDKMQFFVQTVLDLCVDAICHQLNRNN